MCTQIMHLMKIINRVLKYNYQGYYSLAIDQLLISCREIGLKSRRPTCVDAHVGIARRTRP